MNATPISTTLAGSQPAPFWQVVRRFPRPVWILFVGTFINKFGTFVVPFLALHLTRLGYSAGQAGLGLVAYGAGHFSASLLGGHLADSLGRRNTIVLSMSTGSIAMLLLSQAETLGIVLVLAFATGLTMELYKPASSALLADLVPAPDRVTAYAAYRFAINAGWAFGPAVAGLLAQHSYFWLFAGDAATGIIFGGIVLTWLPNSSGRIEQPWSVVSSAVRSVTHGVRVAFRDKPFLQLLLATLATGLVFVQMPTTLGLEIKAAGYTDSVYGLVLTVNGLLVVLCEIPLSTYLRKLPPRSVIAVGAIVMGVGMGLNSWADAPWEYALAMAVVTGGEIVSMSVSLAYAARLAPEAMRGRYMGLYGLTWATALTCGPGIGLWTFARWPDALWGACICLGLIAAAILWVSPSQSRSQTRGARHEH